MEIHGAGINELYCETLNYLKVVECDEVLRRTGRVREYSPPLTIINTEPRNRVLYDPQRNANPFFHCMEFVWMAAGGNDVRWIAQFNKRMLEYAEPGEWSHGAYGHRWMHHFGINQIPALINVLNKDRMTRRAYVQMWDTDADLGRDFKDIPCNVGISFQMDVDNDLNAYVFNRSNDLIWGMLGANAVHFSMLLEVVAQCIAANPGQVVQISANPHLYERHFELVDKYAVGEADVGAACIPIEAGNWKEFSRACDIFTEDHKANVPFWWLREVARPMYEVYINKEHIALNDIACPAWRQAATEWVRRNREPQAA